MHGYTTRLCLGCLPPDVGTVCGCGAFLTSATAKAKDLGNKFPLAAVLSTSSSRFLVSRIFVVGAARQRGRHLVVLLFKTGWKYIKKDMRPRKTKQ